MKVKYVGFGGLTEVPCYEDECGKLYFDLSDGNPNTDISLYDGAYRTEDGDIWGEPCTFIADGKDICCEKPFKRSPFENVYRLLGRLVADCNYFLGYGNGYEGHLWAGNVKDQIAKMKELWNSLPLSDKPEWLSLEDIQEYETKMSILKAETYGN